MTAVNALACLLPTHKSWMKTHTHTNFDWPTFHPPSYADIQNIHTMMYCMNLRQVTPRLCRLCRQHCQIIPLICSIRIGKVYIQPQASNSNIILKLFSVKFTVSLPLAHSPRQTHTHTRSFCHPKYRLVLLEFHRHTKTFRAHFEHVMRSMQISKREWAMLWRQAKYNSWNFWNYIDKLNFMKLTAEERTIYSLDCSRPNWLLIGINTIKRNVVKCI